MPKSRIKIKKTILTSTTTLVGTSDEHDLSVCCSNRNCPSHWQNRLSEKLKLLQESKLKSSSSTIDSKHQYHLAYSDVLLKLFHLNEYEENDTEEIYSKPIAKSILLNKHNFFLNQLSKHLNESTYTFLRTNLHLQINYRMILLLNNRFESSEQLKINRLRINHIHRNTRLVLKIISSPLWNRSAVHVIVQDDNNHCLRLSIYNWFYVIDTRQNKSFNYIQERLKNLLAMNSSIILLDPWLKKCQDGDISLRCESPNTHLILLDYERQDSVDSQINIEELRQLGNSCYQAHDSLSAIQFYTFGLKQLDEQQDKELTSKGQTIGPKTDEREQHRIRFLSNRCACYLRERHALLAIADTGILISLTDFARILSSSRITTGKLLFRCLNAHLQLGLYDRVESLLKSHPIGLEMSGGGENSASMAILERELIRLRNESNQGQYDLDKILTNKSAMMFSDLSHHHAECQRDDLFEIRSCQIENTYPKGSYGVYALKDLDVGTLLVVEQPFASIDNRLVGEDYGQTINSWKRNSKITCCSNETLRLLNEIEKQLFIGQNTQSTFEKIQLMQPIRQWLDEQPSNGTSAFLLDGYEQLLLEKQQWRKSLPKRLPSSPHIPWHVLFKTQQQNPYKSQTTLGWYSLGSMFNHSCLPNCLWYLIGDYLFIYVCASNVREGDELTISYCPLWISSIKERTNLLRQYEINSCQCRLCSYDRSVIDEYENELIKFVNIRALARQKTISNLTRWKYFSQLKCQYEVLIKRFHQRPISFLNEFLDLESISAYFQEENLEDEIKEFLHQQEKTFLQRLATISGVTLPHISNPIVFFGRQIQLLINHLERFSSSDVNQWKQLLHYLYEIYTFKCYSSANQSEKTIEDYKQFFTNLFQTQSSIINENKLE